MSRDYRLIKGGKFTGESFNVNAWGSLWFGELFKTLGLPTSRPLCAGEPPSIPHEITGPVAAAIRSAISQPDFPQRLTSAIEHVRKLYPDQSNTEEDFIWAMTFLKMANNPEGFASDYCEPYFTTEP